MLNTINLDLDKSDFFDSFNDDEFWQKDAKKILIEMLIKTCKNAKEYKKSRSDGKISAAHNAICISGSRGAGKTVFLRNAEKIWKGSIAATSGDIGCTDLYFAETIDPTLLNGHDNFANVIIAQLYNAVENRLSSPSVDITKKNKFYTSLKKLAEALGKKSDFSDHTGIDRILKYRSGIQVEVFFHEYVEQCIELLGCHAIVVPIDDVDMALNRAVEVLDEVRRLLSCPYIIPIVSGDHELYSHMVSVHFEKNAVDDRISDVTVNSGHQIGKLLAKSYLTKIFPNHLRLPLLPIERLLPHLLIKEDGKSISFFEYEKMLTAFFFPLCNGSERSTEYPKPNSAREVTQLIKTLTPSKLQNHEQHDLWNTFKSWAEQKQHGATYTNAVSNSQLSDYNSTDNLFRFDQLLAFNPILQAQENVAWASKKFLSEQEVAIADLIGTGVKDKDKEKALEINDNTNIIKSIFTQEMKTLRSMPALEFYTSAMTITKTTVQEDKSNLLLAVYTHHDYYGKQGNRNYSIFFSRAFEILSTSLLSLSNNISVTNWKDQLSEIIERVPFYCVHAINPTKYLEGEEEEEEPDTSILGISSSEVAYNINPLVEQIREWEKIHKGKLTALDNLSLIPLLHYVFNKVFTQLHLLRTEISASKNSTAKKYETEHLTDTARRFEYMIINAFASSLQEKYVIQANIGIGTSVETLRNHDKFMNADQTLSRNMQGYTDQSKTDIRTKLLNIIWSHPIFVDLNQSKKIMSDPKFKYGPKNKSSTPTKIAPQEILPSLKNWKKILKNDNKGTNKKDLVDWIDQNVDEASKIYENAQQERKERGDKSPLTAEQEKMFNVLENEFNKPDSGKSASSGDKSDALKNESDSKESASSDGAKQ
ncbi:antiviral RADAR system adenosine triphosphatase RdrA [Colwellia sp. MT41]|uniref:antiviral RADAR system adenosine triphosphatase RdrA n=1 Tax=Colwellia sp. MT41 TaxID=58049 RepID=UPI0018DBC0F4|nr:antiviral RADAR system adenosine triphosphatase RdrA [Colwellia sp. MT41]